MTEPEPARQYTATYDDVEVMDNTYPVAMTGAQLADFERRIIWMLRLVWTLQQKRRKIVKLD